MGQALEIYRHNVLSRTSSATHAIVIHLRFDFNNDNKNTNVRDLYFQSFSIWFYKKKI